MAKSRSLHIRFFAVLREQAGVSELEFPTDAHTPSELYAELRAERGLVFPAALLRVAINEKYATMGTPLQAGDRVVFIPPVAGG
ncbi:MAG: molybdopterin converting factor subunit 1 [Opitutaceae bacterium]